MELWQVTGKKKAMGLKLLDDQHKCITNEAYGDIKHNM